MNPTVIMNCVKCDKYITDLRESCIVLEQNMKIISQIEQWISPQILTSTDYLCQACWNLAIEVINIKNEPSDDIQPGNSHTDDDTDPLKVKTELPDPSNEVIEISQINNTFEKDPLKMEPEDTNFNNERNEAELPNSDDQTKLESQLSNSKIELEAQLTNSGYESEQNVSIPEESNSDDESEQEDHQSNSKDGIRPEAKLSHSGNDDTESDYISAKRKKLDKNTTICSKIEEIQDNNFSKQKVTKKDVDHSNDAEKKEALRKGCSSCGRSILRTRSRLIAIENPTDTQQLLINLILASVTREVTEYDRICHRCYQRFNRRVKLIQMKTPSNIVHSTPSTNTRDTNKHIVKKQDQTNAVAQSEQNDPSLDSDPDWVPRTELKAADNVQSEYTHPSEPEPQVQLRNYRRAPSTARSCIFFRCKSGTRSVPKEDLRMRVLLDYNYYIPVRGRICSFHLMSNNWDQLFHSQNSISTFNSEQIEDIFYLLKQAKSQANFDNILSVNDNLLQYLTGMNKKKFFDLLNEVPEIKNIRRGVCGLVAVLIKHYRHESHTKISSVMNVSRETIRRLMTAVNEALTKRGDILEAYVSSKLYSRLPYKNQNKL